MQELCVTMLSASGRGVYEGVVCVCEKFACLSACVKELSVKKRPVEV